MRAHQIDNGVVVNTIEVEALDKSPNLLDASLGGEIGDLWDEVAFTKPAGWAAAQAAKAAELARIAAVEISIATDTTISTLKAMTNAEFDTWWSANVTTLAQANGVLKRLARLVIRRVL